MTRERERTVPVAPARPSGRRFAGRVEVGRATLVVAAIVAGAAGHLLLAPAAGARGPGPVAPVPAASFRLLELPAADGVDPGAGQGPDGRAAGVRASAGAPEATAFLDEWGLALSAGTGLGPAAVLTPEPTPPPPVVVRFRPRDGWANVDRHAQLSVRFTTAMDHATTEAAFHATLDGVDLAGTLRWAEGDTVLVLRPSAALPYGARVELRVDGDARSAAGLPVTDTAAIGFTVEPRPPARPSSGGSPASGWQWPLVGPITQGFGQSLTVYGFHQGIDIDGGSGDPVLAARAGVVVVAGHADECGGLQVRIDHGGGLLTWYRHLSAVETAVGASVAAGTLVGRVGDTGCAFGSHLHFGVTLGGEFVDPLRYLPVR